MLLNVTALRFRTEIPFWRAGHPVQWTKLMLGNFAFITSNVDAGVDQVEHNLSAFPSRFYTV